MIRTRKPAGTIISTEPRSRRSPIAHRLAADAVPERIDELRVAGRDGDAVAEPTDERQRDGGHDVRRAEGDTVAADELVFVRGPPQLEPFRVAPLAVDRAAGCGR